ncbi:MAG: DNA glycosylase [Bacillota bacterium]|nr:DNA glycosylase [Bacillota bacterium]
MKVVIPGFNLLLTANSGQSFRFNQRKDGAFSLIAGNRGLKIRELEDSLFEFSCSEEAFLTFWQDYFDLKRDYSGILDRVKDADDYLKSAAEYAGGVRILRQEPFETLIAFIISQRKSIPSIKACVENLSKMFGEPLSGFDYAFPSPEALANADEKALKACGLGYRVPYVKKTAQMVDSGEVDLISISLLDDNALEEQLMRFPGVGKKVASCVMLFSYARMEVFPVDTWISKVLDKEYEDGFPFDRYQGITGILQQYLFCYARHLAGRA